jgi:hypothetical protein
VAANSAELPERDDGSGSGWDHLGALVGTWTTEGRHPELPGPIHGRAVFEWLEGGRFLIWRSHHDRPEVPDAMAVIGAPEGRMSMHYFDSRGVFRVYSVAIGPATWRFWRDEPGFAQRFTGTFGDGGATITGHGQLSTDGATWRDDLDLIYRKVTRA